MQQGIYVKINSTISSIKGFKVNGKEVPFNHSDKLVYSLLVNLGLSNDKITTSQEYIATLFGMSIKGVRDCLQRLTKLNLIEITKVKGNLTNHSYKTNKIEDCGFEVVFPDYSKELKSSNAGGSNLSVNTVNKIRKGNVQTEVDPQKSNTKNHNIDESHSYDIFDENIPF